MLDAGQINTIYFDSRPDRLKIHGHVVEGMLSELPWPVQGGLTDEEACRDKNGKKWTEYLLFTRRLLGLGVRMGKVRVIDSVDSVRYALI